MSALGGRKKILAFSGGADSTSMAYKLKENGEDDFELLHTPTGDELPEVGLHVQMTADALGVPLILPAAPTLISLIDAFEALPNHRQRWCTRMIKIVPCIAYLKQHPGSTLLVGLRADEEEREGMYGAHATYRFPLREWGWHRKDVLGYLKKIGVTVPPRTDCVCCPYQRLGEWRDLWQKHPDLYARAEAIEARIGHTFRSPGRDTWPAGLRELRGEFERGRKLRGDDKRKLNVIGAENDGEQSCRVCRG